MKVRSYGQWLGVTQEYKGKKHYQTFVVSSHDHSKTNKKCRNICCNRTKVELNCYLSRLLWLKYNQKFAPAPGTILIKVLREFGLRILEPNCKLSKPPWLNQIQRVCSSTRNYFISQITTRIWIKNLGALIVRVLSLHG